VIAATRDAARRTDLILLDGRRAVRDGRALFL